MIEDWNIKKLTEEVVENILLEVALDPDLVGTVCFSHEGWINWYDEVEDIHRSISSRDETHVADGVIGSVIEKSKALLNEAAGTTLPQRLDNMNDTEEKQNLIRSFFKHHKPKEWMIGDLRDKASDVYEPCVSFETVSDGDWHNSKIYKEGKQVCEVSIEVHDGSLNIITYDADTDDPSFIRKYSLTDLVSPYNSEVANVAQN